MAYGYYASITIDNTKVSGTSNLTDFPVLVKGTYDGTGGEPDIRTTANGGNVQNTASGGASGSLTVPADLVFSPNTDGSSPYDFEIEYYDASTGEIVAHIEIPTLDYNDDTVLYMVYGDSGVSTSQEDVNGTWNSNYKGVWHLNEDPTGTSYDSTSNGNDLASAGDLVSGDLVATGQISKNSIRMDRTADNYLEITSGNQTGLNITSDLYVEAVIYLTDTTNANNFVIGKGHNIYALSIDSTNVVETLSGNDAWNQSTLAISDSAWEYVGCWWDGSNANMFHDDNAVDANSDNHSPSDTSDLGIGARGYDGGQGIIGDYDEARIAVTFTDDWRKTTYNTLMDNSNFYSMGSEAENEISAGIAASKRSIQAS